MSAVVSTAEKPRVRKWLPHLGTWDCALSGKWLQGAGNRNQNNGGLVSRRPRNRGSSRGRGLASGRDAGCRVRSGSWRGGGLKRETGIVPIGDPDRSAGEGTVCLREMHFTIQAGTLSRMRVYKRWETDV